MRSILSQVLDLSILPLPLPQQQHDQMIKGNVLSWDKKIRREKYTYAVWYKSLSSACKTILFSSHIEYVQHNIGCNKEEMKKNKKTTSCQRCLSDLPML